MQGWEEEEEEEKHALAHAQMQATQVWVCRVELPAVCWPRFLPHAGPDNCNLYGLLPTRAGHPCDWGFLIFERVTRRQWHHGLLLAGAAAVPASAGSTER